jgi:enoyl-CoA hydratase/carnithine racemase
MTDTFHTLAITRPSPDVVVAYLDRPDRLNAITFEMFAELTRLQAMVEADDAVRVLVLTDTGRAFCAGLDLDEAATMPDMPAATMLTEQEGWADSIAGFHRMSKPVIAAVNGAAAGAGMGLALAADIRVATPTARFNAAFVRIGLSGGDVGTSYFLPRLVGLGRATEILLTGRFMGADEALAIGLMIAVVGPNDLLDHALEIARTICGNTPTGMKMTKRVLAANVDAPSLTAALDMENRNQVLATRTDDMTEALAAFRAKRPPVFVGH